MPEVKIDVVANTHGAPDQLKQTETALAGVERQGSSLGGSLGGLWKQFAAGVIAAGVVQKAAHALTDQFKESIKAAIDAEKANKNLSAALEITGRGPADLAKHFQDYAGELQKVTVYDDEAIKGAQALLIQLTHLDKDGIDKATRGAIGMASVFGMDLTSAATLMAKAMAGSTAALSRYGIRVAENLPLEEKQRQLLEQVEKMFGRARAETDTFGGRLAVLKNRWGEVQEAAGAFITEQKGVINILDKASQAVLDYLQKNQMLREATETLEEQENRRTEWLGRAAAAAGWQYQQMSKLIEAYGGITPRLLADINAEKYGIEIKQQYQRVIREERAAWLELEAARKAAEKGTVDSGKAAEEAAAKFISFTRQIQVLHSASKAIDPVPFKIVGDAISSDVLYPLTKLPPAFDRAELAEKSLVAATKNGAQEMKRSLADFARDAQAAMEKVKQSADVIFNGLNSIFDQSQQNREIAIENEYKARLEAINLNISDEQSRQSAIEALEAEYEIKRTSARRKSAKEQKAVAMMEAVVNTASAVTEALPNLVLAAIVAAMGAVQVATIAAQPIPLAKGGYFKEETVLPTGYRVAESWPASQGEIVSPVPMMRQIVREETAKAGRSITFGDVNISISTQTLDERSVGRIGPALWREFEAQARLRGYRLATAGA